MYVGLTNPMIAKLNEDGTYQDGFTCGEAMGMDISVQISEASCHGDDRKVEYDRVFKNGNITLETTRLPVEAAKVMFGHQVTDDKQVVYNIEDVPNYVGVGIMTREKLNGNYQHVAMLIHKAMFSDSNDNFATVGENIEYKTPSITGQALANDEGVWKTVKTFATKAEALTWLKTELNIKDTPDPIV